MEPPRVRAGGPVRRAAAPLPKARSTIAQRRPAVRLPSMT